MFRKLLPLHIALAAATHSAAAPLQSCPLNILSVKFTDDGRVMANYQIIYGQYHIWDSATENTPNAPKSICLLCLPKPKSWISLKKGFIVHP